MAKADNHQAGNLPTDSNPVFRYKDGSYWTESGRGHPIGVYEIQVEPPRVAAGTKVLRL